MIKCHSLFGFIALLQFTKFSPSLATLSPILSIYNRWYNKSNKILLPLNKTYIKMNCLTIKPLWHHRFQMHLYMNRLEPFIQIIQKNQSRRNWPPWAKVTPPNYLGENRPFLNRLPCGTCSITYPLVFTKILQISISLLAPILNNWLILLL